MHFIIHIRKGEAGMEKCNAFRKITTWMPLLSLALIFGVMLIVPPPASAANWNVNYKGDINSVSGLLDVFKKKFGINVEDTITEREFRAHNRASRIYGTADKMRLSLLKKAYDGLVLINPKVYDFAQAAQPLHIVLAVSYPRYEDMEGSYDPYSNAIYLYSGNEKGSPVIILHEYAHVLTYLWMSLYNDSERALLERWAPLNRGVAYSGAANHDAAYDALSRTQRNYFISDYAISDVYEDIAETFSIYSSNPNSTWSETIDAKYELFDDMLGELLTNNPSRVRVNPNARGSGGVGVNVQGRDHDANRYDDEYCDVCGEWLGNSGQTRRRKH
jgi:hypothetical protein